MCVLHLKAKQSRFYCGLWDESQMHCFMKNIASTMHYQKVSHFVSGIGTR